jgi:Na+/H+-dicarboxylate symporter
MTIAETHRPSQFEGQKTESEKRFDEAMESIKDIIPREVFMALSDQAAGRALDAYDFGVLVGLGKLTPEYGYTITEDIVRGVSESLVTLSQFVEHMAERV